MIPHSILIVDALQDKSNVYRELLELEGYRVHTAGSPDAAVRVALAHHPAVVLIDGDPHGVHASSLGARICEEMERVGARVPTLVAVRGDLLRGDKPNFPRFSAILAKPFDVDVLEVTLRQSVSDWLLRSEKTSTSD